MLSYLSVNGLVVGFKFVNQNSMSLLQLIKYLGLSFPGFCFYESLEVVGNCRSCLIAIEGRPKLQIACLTKLEPGMCVWTTAPGVRLAQLRILEYILITHPLDCPICDQGGECDLQDLTFTFGADISRYLETRAQQVNVDISFNAAVMLITERCILCTRCLRFESKIFVQRSLGIIGRGRNSELSYYDLSVLNRPSVFYGNIVDICPVGALSNVYFNAHNRVWDYVSVGGIDITDTAVTRLLIGTDMKQIYRISALSVNAQTAWVADSVRYSADGLLYNRIDRPQYYSPNNCFVVLEWTHILRLLHHWTRISYNGANWFYVYGSALDYESCVFFKTVLLSSGCRNVFFQNNHVDNVYWLAGYCEIYRNVCMDISSLYFFSTKVTFLLPTTQVVTLGLSFKKDVPLLYFLVLGGLTRLKVDLHSFGGDALQVVGRGGVTGRYKVNLNLVKFLALFTKPVAARGAANLHKLVICNPAIFNYCKDPFYLIALVQQVCTQLKIRCEFLVSRVSYLAALHLGLENLNTEWFGSIPLYNSRMYPGRVIYFLGVGNDFTHYIRRRYQTYLIYQGTHKPSWEKAFGKQIHMYLPTSTQYDKISHYLNFSGKLVKMRPILKKTKYRVYSDAELFCLFILDVLMVQWFSGTSECLLDRVYRQFRLFFIYDNPQRWNQPEVSYLCLKNKILRFNVSLPIIDYASESSFYRFDDSIRQNSVILRNRKTIYDSNF